MGRMERKDGLQVVLGASGGTGRALVDELVRQGRRVRAVSRGPAAGLPAGVEHVQADLYEPADAVPRDRGRVRRLPRSPARLREVGGQLRAAQCERR